jgi:hypothetical protein
MPEAHSTQGDSSNMKKSITQQRPVILICMIALLVTGAASHAADVISPAYSAAELAQVREWEKTWVGKRIDKTNVEQVADLLPESYAGIYKNPEEWGGPPEGIFFTIVPYTPVPETQGFAEATAKYAPLVRKNADGTIANVAEIAGRPFLNPENGLEAAYNFEFNNHGDSAHYRRFSPNINPKNKSERVSDQEYWEYYFVHRTEVEPRPAVPDNPKGYHRGTFMHMYAPPEFLNTRMFTIRFTDPREEDLAYLWYSQFRRIRRLATTQRTDAIDGSDLIYDDEYFWDGQLLRNSYTLSGTKELLSSRHTDMKQTMRVQGQALVSNLTLERCKTLVVQVVNNNPDYIYSKRVWYLDPESYLILWTEIYDRKGSFWKCFMQNCAMVKTQTGAMKHFIVGSKYIDFQSKHAGLSNQQHTFEPVISGPIPNDMFTVGYLQKTN